MNNKRKKLVNNKKSQVSYEINELSSFFCRILCETVRDMIGKLDSSSPDSEIDEKCATLTQKLDSLLQTLNEETEEEEEEEDTMEVEDDDNVEERITGELMLEVNVL